MYGLYGERSYFLGALEVILIYNLTKSSPHPVMEEIVRWVSKTSHELRRRGREMSPVLLSPKVSPLLSSPLIFSEKTYSSPLRR